MAFAYFPNLHLYFFHIFLIFADQFFLKFTKQVFLIIAKQFFLIFADQFFLKGNENGEYSFLLQYKVRFKTYFLWKNNNKFSLHIFKHKLYFQI